MQIDCLYWESIFLEYVAEHSRKHNDASHDLGHFRRVYQAAKSIADLESSPSDLLIILAAAYFHDIVSLPKDHPDNKMSSSYAAAEAKEILAKMNFPEEKIESVCHAIRAHSFSAGLSPQTIEAKIIQDADRMEALGALGAMRTFYVSGRLGRKPYDSNDMRAEKRPLDDKIFGLDHFYVKLFKLPHLLQTQGGRLFANKRVEFLKYFVEELEMNIKDENGGALVVVKSCYEAGANGLELFDPLDPLAQNRLLNSANFATDQIIESHEEFPIFISRFLSELKSEIKLQDKV